MDIKKRIQELSLDQKAKLYYMMLLKKGAIDTLPENPKAAYVQSMMDEPASSKFSEPIGEDLDDYRLEPEDMEDPDEDLVIIGSGYLDIKSNFGERPSQTNGEYAEIGQKVVDQLHNGDKEAALDFIYSKINENRDEEDEENDRNLAIDDIPNSLRELSTELGYLSEAEYGKYFGGRTRGVDGMEGETDLNAASYEKVTFVYTEQGGRFYGLDVYESKDQDQRSAKLKYDEANEWLKDTLGSFEGVKATGIDELIPRRYNSGMEDLDLIVTRLEELGIEASHGDYMDIS